MTDKEIWTLACQYGNWINGEVLEINDAGVLEFVRAIKQAENQELLGYAGVRIWIGNHEITQTLTKAQVEHERVAGMSITDAAQMCLDLLKTEMERNHVS